MCCFSNNIQNCGTKARWKNGVPMMNIEKCDEKAASKIAFSFRNGCTFQANRTRTSFRTSESSLCFCTEHLTCKFNPVAAQNHSLRLMVCDSNGTDLELYHLSTKHNSERRIRIRVTPTERKVEHIMQFCSPV